MQSLLPPGYGIQRILSDPAWRNAGAAYYVGVATSEPAAHPSLVAVAPKLVLFRREGRRLEKGSVVPTFTAAEIRTGSDVRRMPSGYARCLAPAPGRPAHVVVIRSFAPRRIAQSGFVSYDVSVYRFEHARLQKLLQVPAASTPWAGDLDGDGDAEIVAWHHIRPDLWPFSPLQWPSVHTLVGDGYEQRTEEFAPLFREVARVFADREPQYTQDPKVAEYVGRAYEILDQNESAIAAYGRAEVKYGKLEQRAAGNKHTQQARLYRQAAASVRERRLRLEAAQSDPSTPQ
jgi:hypothetical protein